MEEALEDYVLQLKNCGPFNYEDQDYRFRKAKELTGDIRDIFKNSEKERKEFIISVLLDENNGLLPFLSKLRTTSTKNADYLQTITNIMTILELILTEEHAKFISFHLVDIKNSLLLFMNSQNATHRKHSFSVLGQVVAMAAQPSYEEIVDQLDLPTLCKNLFQLLSRPRRDSSTKTNREFLNLLGSLAHYFPNAMKEKAGRIIHQVLHDLETEVKMKDGKDSALIEGSFEALTGLLYTFHVVVSPIDLKKIHDIMLILISKNISKRPTAQVAAMNKLLVEHASIFSEWLLGKYDIWFNTLKSYALSADVKVSKGGLKAFEKFIDECIKGLKSQADITQKSTILEFFVGNLCEIMESDQSPLKLRKIGMKALGECSCSVSEPNASHIFEYLLKKTALICIEDETTMNLAILPICLESLGLVLRRISILKIEQAQQLQKMCVYLFNRYLDIAEKKRPGCGRSMAVFLAGAHCAVSNPLDYSAFVGSIVTQGLIRCSRPNLQLNSIKKHVVVWAALMNFSHETDLPFGLEERIYVSNVLDAQLIIAVSTIIRRLNFSMIGIKDSLETVEENGNMCRPENPADWQLFHNLVELLEDLLKAMNSKDRLENSIISLGGEIIELSTKFPLVPGLYRLVALVLSIIGEDLPDVHRPSYQFFISNLIDQLAQLSDDILFAAVQAILASPTWLVTSVKGTVTGALTSALKIGLTYLPMAEWPLSALEHWQATLPFSVFESIMEDILPCLETYLSSAEHITEEALFIGDKRLARTTSNIDIPIEKDAWNKIQRRVMRLIGRMGPKCSRLVVQNEDEVVAKLAVGWQINAHLDFNLPLGDMTPNIQIDVFLPRILHLVQHTSDLKLRMAACEFLHASVTFLTGTISRRTEEIRRRHSLTPLYSKLFPTILSLAVDADEAIKKLFQDLLFQLVHWFSRPTFQRKDATGRLTLLGEETALLVEQLMDSACGLDTSLVRDLACDCLKEFLEWSIKQCTDTTLWEDPAGPDFLFQKIRASATHPSAHQRLGAAVVMNKLYHIIRDSEPLASIYTMDLLTHFVVSLSLAERDASSLGTVQQANQVLYHLNRTIYLRKQMYATKDSRRRAAPFLVHGTLPELLDFLLKYAFGIHKHSRQVCVELCEALARPQSFKDVATEYLARNSLEILLPKEFPLPDRLDVYRWLLHHRVIETSLCDANAVFLGQFESFAEAAENRLKRRTEVSKDITSEDFLAWLNFLGEYLPKSKNNLFVRIELLVHCVLLPAAFGFSNFATGSRQQLYAVLENIFPLLKQHNGTILSVLSRADFQPDRLNWMNTDSLDIVHGLVLIVSSGCLDGNVSFSKPPNILLKLAIDTAMNLPDDASNLPTTLDKTSNKLVELALLLGLKMDILANELKNPGNIPDSTVTYGQSLRSKLGRTLFLLIFRQLEKVDPFLPQMGNGDPQQWTLLLELLQAAQQAPRDLTEKKTWIVQSLLDSWNVLERHANSYNQRVDLRLVVDYLVNINANLVGRNISVKNWVINSWNHPSTEVSFASEFVQLLNIFAVDCSETEEKSLTSSLQQFFTSHFPSKTSGLETNSDKSSYFSIINRMIGIARVPVVFQFLVDVFALEPGHSSVRKFIDEIQIEGWMKNVSDRMLDRVLNKLFQHAKTRTVTSKIRMEAIKVIYVPLLEIVPIPAVERHLKQMLEELTQLEEESRSGIESCSFKSAFFSLLAVAIDRVDYERLIGCLNTDYCALKSSQPSSDGKDLLRTISRIVLKVGKMVAPSNETELEIYQNMQSSAFNLMQSVVTVTSADEDTVDKLLFRPLSTKTPPLWNAIVGTTKQYKLNVDVDRKINKMFTQYKNKISLQDRQTKGYIPSQFMHDSSLSEDVHRFDFNQASVPESGTLYETEKMSTPLSTSTQEETPSIMVVKLDELNEHPCMKPLVFFLTNLYEKRTSTDIPGPEPKWMNTLREVLLLPNIHNNVALFLVRLVINLKSIFQPYAKSWYNALLFALLRKIGGDPLNNLFRDCLNMLLEWTTDVPPSVDDVEFPKLASNVVQFIIKNMGNSKTEIARDNLDMIKTVLGVWEKIPMKIPHEMLDEILSSSQNKDLTRGLQILDSIIFHGFLPISHEYRPRFKQTLIDLLNRNEKRSVTRLCAALCGSVLLRVPDKEFEKKVYDTLQKSANQRQSDVFVVHLYEVANRYPGILSKFASTNLSFLGGLYGGLRAKCLENLAISWQFLEDPWKEIGFETIESVLKGKNPAELCPVLLLLKNLIPRVDISEWKPLWPTLARLSRHNNVECRSRLYEVFKKALDLSDPLDPIFAQAILRACADQDQELAVKMQNFLAEKLPTATTDRLLAYVTDFYYPGSEEHFLPYCSYFLLERATQSHVYRDPIFEQPLADIPFEVFDLASLSSQSSSQRPWFNSFGRSVSHMSLQHGYLRATQQGSSRATPYLTQSPANWLMNETQSKALPSTSQSPIKTVTQTTSREVTSLNKTWKQFEFTGPPSPRKSSYTSPLKRTQNSSQPPIYRKYRKGELPDIQIPPSALIAPLQAVALQDAPTAKILFGHLLSAIRNKVKEIQGSDNEFTSKLNAALEAIIARTNSRGPRSSSLIAAVMEYIWTNAIELSADTSLLVRIAKSENLQPLGILVLESSLPYFLDSEKNKKPRLHQISRSNSCWFNVADLYGDIGDVDSVRAVVTHLADCREQTKMAIECEAKGDWSQAFRNYSEVLKSKTSAAELEFCNEYRLKCLEKLGKWDEIHRLKPKKEPWDIRSRVRSVLQSSQAGRDAFELDRISLPTVDPALLPDLALSALCNKNTNRATLCISKASDHFMSRYSQLSPLNFGGRQSLLQQICAITELQSFTSESGVTWNASLPQSGDDLVAWDSLLALRTYFALSEGKKRNEASESVNMLRLRLADIALEQKNVGLAQKLVGIPLSNQQSMLPLQQLIKSKVFAMDPCDTKLNKIDKLILAKETINNTDFADVLVEARWKIDRQRFEASLCAQLFQVTKDIQPNDLVTKQAKLVELWNVPPSEVILEGLKHSRCQAEMAENQGNATDLAEAYYILAKYCYEWKNVIPGEDYATEITKSILASMRHGSVDGQSLFPLVITTIQNDFVAAAAFESSRSRVPLQMFLPWVNQLVSYFAMSPAIARLLIDIAEKHPTHVRVPFGITRNNLTPDVINMSVTRALESNLPVDPTWKMFLKSIDYLHPPEKAADELLKSETCAEDFPAFQSKYLNLLAPSDTSAHGQVHYDFSKFFTPKFQEAFDQKRQTDLINLLKNFKKKTLPGRKSLRDYSPWLASYRLGGNIRNELEIPSLKGKTIKVEAFRDDIQYLESKQLPVRLTLVVNGAQEFPVLLKHGEDVRQDERIVQLLNIIDTALVRDVDSKKRNLRIRTFQVIPLTTTCGIFEWLTDTLTLKAFLETDSDYCASSSDIRNQIQKLYPTRDFQKMFQISQEKLTHFYTKLVNSVYRYGLRNALKNLSQSPEAFYYLRNRIATSHGTQCLALWILGVGDRHLKNFLISTRNGDVIGIDYGYAFGTATFRLQIPEIVPCRLTTQFQYLIPGLGLNGPIRESMNHTLRIAKMESVPIIAALSVFVTEPTINWLSHAEEKIKDIHLANVLTVEGANNWSPKEIVQRTENLLSGVHPREITCRDLQKNNIFSNPEGQKVLAKLLSIVRGESSSSTASNVDPNTSTNKRKSESISCRGNMPSGGLSAKEQVDCLIEQAVDPLCLSRMYVGWEPWV